MIEVVRDVTAPSGQNSTQRFPAQQDPAHSGSKGDGLAPVNGPLPPGGKPALPRPSPPGARYRRCAGPRRGYPLKHTVTHGQIAPPSNRPAASRSWK